MEKLSNSKKAVIQYVVTGCTQSKAAQDNNIAQSAVSVAIQNYEVMRSTYLKLGAARVGRLLDHVASGGSLRDASYLAACSIKEAGQIIKYTALQKHIAVARSEYVPPRSDDYMRGIQDAANVARMVAGDDVGRAILDAFSIR